ncbi:MAG TPA: hypothetical protein VK427_19305 [Kofleriaceae bacterium]|nr:hypothetical protein [Kofleriaceae bacterium]
MQRLRDSSAIEARLLDLAHTTTAKLTAPILAYYAPCSIDDAQRVLDELAGRDLVTMEVGDDGTITYELRGRQQLPRPAAPAALPTATALVPQHRPQHQPSALVAGLLSVWIPGAGHLYAGRIVSALLWFLAVGAGYVLILPGLVLHLFCIVSAASAARLRAHVQYQLPAAA